MRLLKIILILLFTASCAQAASNRGYYPKFKAWNTDGTMCAGCYLYTYEAGTSTENTTYSDADQTSANTNPIVLNSYGEADVYLAEATKFVLKDADTATIWTVDDVDPTTVDADDVAYDNGDGYFSAANVQDAIDEIGANLALKANTTDTTTVAYPNRVINSEMMIDQRSEGAARTTDGFIVDRWQCAVTSEDELTYSAQRTTGIGNARYSAKFTVTNPETAVAADEVFTPFIYKFLGYDVADLAGETVVISFYFNAVETGNYSVCLTSGDVSYSYCTVFEYTTTETEQLVSESITVDASNAVTNTTTGTGLRLFIAAYGGSNYQASADDEWVAKGVSTSALSSTATNWVDTDNNYVQISEVQLRKGSYQVMGHKTRIDYLQECQAYYQKSFVPGTAPAQNIGSLAGATCYYTPIAGATASGTMVYFPVQMIGDPTVTFYSPSAANAFAYNVNDSASSTATVAGYDNGKHNGFLIIVTQEGTAGAGDEYCVQWAASAEL